MPFSGSRLFLRIYASNGVDVFIRISKIKKIGGVYDEIGRALVALMVLYSE